MVLRSTSGGLTHGLVPRPKAGETVLGALASVTHDPVLRRGML